MGLFDKNPNEVNYVGGKKHWTDVIKNSGPGELLIWRQPEEDFNNNSTLIVMPGEQAIFIDRGIVACPPFENGTYKLSTENYPFISRLRNAFSGGISTFNCVVYFVRSADSEEIIWGTDSPIQLRDKVWGVRTEARARGAFKVRITNPVLFLEKLVGNNVPFQTQQDLTRYFRNEFQGIIKSETAKYLNSLNQEFIGIDAFLEDISRGIEPRISEALDSYGLACAKFSLSGLDVDISKYDRIDESQIEQIAATRGFQTTKAGFDILGNNWGLAQGAQFMHEIANNPGAGGIAAAGAGVGVGVGVGSAVGNIIQTVVSGPQGTMQQAQPNPMMNQPSGRFAQAGTSPYQQVTSGPQEAAQPVQPAAPQEDPIATLQKLKQMLDMGLITQAEYDGKKAEIMARM